MLKTEFWFEFQKVVDRFGRDTYSKTDLERIYASLENFSREDLSFAIKSFLSANDNPPSLKNILENMPKKKPKLNKGFSKRRFSKKVGDNEYYDCGVYLLRFSKGEYKGFYLPEDRKKIG